MTSPGTRSPRRWSESWGAAASAGLILAASLACSSAPTASPASPSPAISAQPTEAASPSPTPGDETPVAQQVLPPASDLPIGQLCSAPIKTTADGNVQPLLCRDGAVNVLAWAYYATISQSILGLGLNPNEGQPQSAMCDDVAHNGATRVEESSAYRLAAAYYGWTFAFDPARFTCG